MNPDDNTLLLLHLNENVIDSSSRKISLLNSGTTFLTGRLGKALDTRNGGYAYASNTVFDMSKYNEFTIDLWYYEYSTSTYSTILGITNSGLGTSANSQLGIMRNGSSQKITLYLYGNSEQIDLSNILLNQWVHIAVVRKGSVIYFFENGILLRTMNINFFRTISDPMFCVGRLRPGDSSFFYGLVDELRISNIARWTSNFTPPTKPY